MIQINGKNYNPEDIPEHVRPLLAKFTSACKRRDELGREVQMYADLAQYYTDQIVEAMNKPPQQNVQVQT